MKGKKNIFSSKEFECAMRDMSSRGMITESGERPESSVRLEVPGLLELALESGHKMLEHIEGHAFTGEVGPDGKMRLTRVAKTEWFLYRPLTLAAVLGYNTPFTCQNRRKPCDCKPLSRLQRLEWGNTYFLCNTPAQTGHEEPSFIESRSGLASANIQFSAFCEMEMN
jgi:hypothetical protein